MTLTCILDSEMRYCPLKIKPANVLGLLLNDNAVSIKSELTAPFKTEYLKAQGPFTPNVPRLCEIRYNNHIFLKYDMMTSDSVPSSCL